MGNRQQHDGTERQDRPKANWQRIAEEIAASLLEANDGDKNSAWADYQRMDIRREAQSYGLTGAAADELIQKISLRVEELLAEDK
jgi:hypothetical protein